MKEAAEVTKDWLVDIKSEAVITLANGFAMLLLDSGEENVPKALKSFSTMLKKLKAEGTIVSEDTTKLAKAMEMELKMNWIPIKSHYEREALMM